MCRGGGEKLQEFGLFRRKVNAGQNSDTWWWISSIARRGGVETLWLPVSNWRPAQLEVHSRTFQIQEEDVLENNDTFSSSKKVRKKSGRLNKREGLSWGRRGGEQTVWKKQLDSIFHSIKYNHQLSALRTHTRARTHTRRLQSGVLIEAGYCHVSMKLEKLISWKTVCFLPSNRRPLALPLSPSVSLIWGGCQINFSGPTLCAFRLFVLSCGDDVRAYVFPCVSVEMKISVYCCIFMYW